MSQKHLRLTFVALLCVLYLCIRIYVLLLSCARPCVCVLTPDVAVGARTCVFVFMPEQGAALLEDLGAQVTRVDAVLQAPLLGV